MPRSDMDLKEKASYTFGAPSGGRALGPVRACDIVLFGYHQVAY